MDKEGYFLKQPFAFPETHDTFRGPFFIEVSVTEEQEGAKVKIVCPSCGGSFKGRLPAKPARGTCPRCQKDLVLLPTGAVDTETKFRRKKEEDDKPTARSVPAGATPAAPPALQQEKTPMFHPTGEAGPVPAAPEKRVEDPPKKKDYRVAVAIFVAGWILTGALSLLKEKPQINTLGTIGSEGLSALHEKIFGAPAQK